MRSARHIRILAIVLGAALMIGLGATGSAVADRLIGSKSIKNDSIRSKDIHNGTIAMRDLRPSVTNKIGQPGPAGPPGPAGQALVATALTPPNAGLGGVHVVEVDSVPATSGAPDATHGTELFADPVHLDPGTYLVQATAQFFDFTGDAEDGDYGVTRLYLDDTAVETSASWSPSVPDDGNNAAQSSGSIVVVVPSGGADLSAKAVIRGGDGGYAGASMIVTRLD